jgi:hypothetical protein
MYETIIYDGPHPTCNQVKKTLSIGHIDHVVEAARVTCGQHVALRGKRVFVEFNDADNGGAPVTSRIFQEDAS